MNGGGSQREGRDLDPSHVEAQAEGERRMGGARGGPGGAGAARERESAMAAMQVPEYGGKQRGGGDYAMVSDGEDDEPRDSRGASGRGTYNLKMPNGGAAPPPPPGSQPLDARQRKQVELAAQLLAKASKKKDKKEKKEAKRAKKEAKKAKKDSRKKERKEKHAKKEKTSSSHKHEKKRKRSRSRSRSR